MTKLNTFTNEKDATVTINKSNVVYKFSCLDCKSSYEGDTDKSLQQHININKPSVTKHEL